MPILPAPYPTFNSIVAPGDPSFAGSLQIYAELYELETGIVRAATTNVIDWEIGWEVDTAGQLSCSFVPGDTGLLTTRGDSHGTLPFTDTLLSATNTTLPGTNITTFGTPFRSLQLRLSLGGNDFLDARKMVLKTERNADVGKPLLTESGNTYWEQYGKIIIPHLSAQNAYFSDIMFADPGTISEYDQKLVGVIISGSGGGAPTSPPTAIPGFGFISQFGKIPYIGGIFKIFSPVPVGVDRFNSFLYIPLICDELAQLPLSVDIYADSFSKSLDTIIKKASGATNTPYVAHYAEDSSNLYNSLTGFNYSNTVVLGQIFDSPLTFYSAQNTNTTFVEEPSGVDTPTPFNVLTDAHIEKGIINTPDYSASYSKAYLVAGSTNCDFPDGGEITAIRYYNNIYSGSPRWNCSVPMLGIKVSDLEGGVYVHIGDQRLRKISPNWGVYDVAIDPVNNNIFAATSRGVYVCYNFVLSAGAPQPSGPLLVPSQNVPQTTATNTWVLLGSQDLPVDHSGVPIPGYTTNTGCLNSVIQKLQLNIYENFPQNVPGYANGAASWRLYCLAGTTGSAGGTQIGLKSGVFSYPMYNPTGIATQGNIITTNSQQAMASLHGGWDGILEDPQVKDFAVLNDQAIFWTNPNEVGVLLGQGIPTTKTTQFAYATVGQDSIDKLIPVQNYQFTLGGPTGFGGATQSWVICISNSVMGGYYTKGPDYTNTTDFTPHMNPVSGASNTSVNIDGITTVSFNNIVVPPPGTLINDVPVTAIACTTGGLYYSTDLPPSFTWTPMNEQSALSGEDVRTVAVGKQYTDTKVYGNSGYSAIATYAPMICASANSYFESQSGGVFWEDRLKDKVTLAARFYELWGALHGQPPGPVPEVLEMSWDLTEALPSEYPQGPNAPDLSQYVWRRERDSHGVFIFFGEKKSARLVGGNLTLQSGVSLLKQGEMVATVSNLYTSPLITTLLCSEQLALVTKKWLLENSSPMLQLTLESSFADPKAGLRFLRPMHIVKVFFESTMYSADGKPHIFMKFENEPFYVISHKIKYGGDREPWAKTTTVLSSEMRKDRLTPDDLAADLQQITRNIQLRSS